MRLESANGFPKLLIVNLKVAVAGELAPGFYYLTGVDWQRDKNKQHFNLCERWRLIVVGRNFDGREYRAEMIANGNQDSAFRIMTDRHIGAVPGKTAKELPLGPVMRRNRMRRAD